MAAPPSVHAVVSHLNNPRGLAVDAGGRIWIAEGGAGGTHCQGSGGNATCIGLTASVSVVDHGVLTRVVRGLISVGGEGGVGTIGVSSVTTANGQVRALLGESGFGLPTSGFPQSLLNAGRAELGQLLTVKTSGAWTTLAAVGNHDYIWTSHHKFLQPDQFPDANPNAVAVIGGRTFVADAGANLLAEVSNRGGVKTLNYFQVPSGSPTDAVPTCVAQGPDGALYVGELLGGTFAPGGARVWRVDVSGGSVHARVWKRGFTTIQGCGFDKWGNFYATEFQTGGLNFDPSASPLGDVVKVAPNGQRTHLGVGQLFWPSGFAAASDGSIYVSNCSIAPGKGFGPCPKGGQLVRIG
jgi:sugar lactone lactonase YvrE